MSIIILDLDNTIADDSWRIPRIRWEHEDPFRRYHDYHSLSGFDKIGNIELVLTGHDVVIFTARPVSYRAVTEEWLNRHNIDWKALLMRPIGDRSHSRELKRVQLFSMRKLLGYSFEDILCAYDDRQDVVDMFMALGVKAECRPIHQLCAYTNPNEKQ